MTMNDIDDRLAELEGMVADGECCIPFGTGVYNRARLLRRLAGTGQITLESALRDVTGLIEIARLMPSLPEPTETVTRLPWAQGKTPPGTSVRSDQQEVSMRIWILSDLHNNFVAWVPPPVRPDVDVVVIAGDVDEHLVNTVLPWLAATFPGMQVVYVPGNHDFYHGRVQRDIEAARAAAHAGLHLLMEGESVVIAGTRFIGATLWTDYRLDPLGPEIAGLNAGDRITGMHDHKYIQSVARDGSPRRWKPADALRAHQRHRSAIEAELAMPFDGPTVVVTHHAPHPRSLRHGSFRTSLDAAYASDMSEILGGPHAPALWIHGHVHAQRDYVLGDTRVVSNPRGYVERKAGLMSVENPDFDPALVIEI